PEMLALAGSVFLIRIFAKTVRAQYQAMTVCLLIIVYGGWQVGDAVVYLAGLPPQELGQLGSLGYITLVLFVAVVQYSLPLTAYGLAALIQKIRKRYSFGFIIETIDE
ncbi:MAG TPA: hypothetical protein VGQ87_00470, partial [Patescibacteria group bacterium]|nr:hypothetical protein [Patescibacteria group bacterium]